MVKINEKPYYYDLKIIRKIENQNLKSIFTNKKKLAKLTVETGDSFITEMSSDEIKEMLKLK